MWVEGDPAELSLDGQPTTIEPTRVAGGQRWRLPARESSTVEVRRGSRKQTFEVRPAVTVPLLDQIGRERTQENLDSLTSQLENHPVQRPWLLSHVGRIALSLGKDDEALRYLRRAIEAHKRAGHITEALHDATAASWIAWWRLWDGQVAEDILESVSGLGRHDPLNEARVQQAHASFLSEQGHLDEAVHELLAATEVARCVADQTFLAELEIKHAELLHRAGRREQATERLDAAARQLGSEGGCIEGDLKVTRSWLQLLDAELGAPLSLGPFHEAEALYRNCRSNPEQRANAALNTALAAIHLERWGVARPALQRSQDSGGGAMVRAWQLEAEGRLALEREQWRDAMRAYNELKTRATIAASLAEQWRGHLGLARALDGLGERAAAADAYRNAESVLDRELKAMQLGMSAGFAGQRWASAAELAELELEAGRADHAMHTVRVARLRSIARQRGPHPSRNRGAAFAARMRLAADASVSWTLPLDELRELEQGRAERLTELTRQIDRVELARVEPRPNQDDEWLLVVFPHPRGRLVFSQWQGQVDAALVTNATWPAFVEEPPSRAELVRYVGAGRFALDRPPVELPVVHSLDLQLPARGAGESDLIAVDPTGNLMHARAEARHWADRLPEAVHLRGSNVTLGAVAERFEANVRLFHYAGHGEADESLFSRLPLAGGNLTTADILAMPTVPESVVLNGCVTAVGPGLVPLGVAEAFVLAGSQRVLGAVRPVSDRDARELSNLLLATPSPWGGTKQWAALVSGGGRSLTAFRVIVP